MSVFRIDAPTASPATATPTLGQASLKELSMLPPGRTQTRDPRRAATAEQRQPLQDGSEMSRLAGSALEEQRVPQSAINRAGSFTTDRLPSRRLKSIGGEVWSSALEFKPANPRHPPVLAISGLSSTGISVTEKEISLGSQSTTPKQAKSSSNIPPATSLTLARVKEFAADASKFEAFLNRIPTAEKDFEIRRLLRTAVDHGAVGDLTATSLISHLLISQKYKRHLDA